ncbi:MAG TPA: NEW3 domain-containing protein [Candidatus Limnocylindrales bacterium]|nr:NEW3 domain-containing protein [Candidatus Limnocylindrales bacterium]
MSIVSLRPSGRATSDETRAARFGARHRTLRRLAAAAVTGALALAVTAPTTLAQDLTITTPYPAVVVSPGSSVSFDIEVKTSTPERVELALSGAPEAWNASLHGGGFVIDAVETNGTDPATVRVDLDVPADATGTTRMTLRGTIGSEVVELPLQVRVEADATGDLTLTTDFPSLRGPSSQTFNFNLTLRNDTAEDLTFSVNAQAPTGWTVTANLTGQSQAASAIVKAGSTSGVTVSATPPAAAAAGTYDIEVVAVAGERNITGALQVEVTGSYDLTVSTSDGRLNGRGAAGSTSPLVVTLENLGTAAITNVKLTATAPTGWEVTFDPDTIASLEADATAPTTVNAQVKPSGDAIAGDYTITVTATGDQSTRDTMEIRYTVETNLLWGVIGVALIVAVAGGVWWVFQRYGRR